MEKIQSCIGKSCLSLRVRTCLVTIAIGQWWFSPHQQYPDWQGELSKDETIPSKWWLLSSSSPCMLPFPPSIVSWDIVVWSLGFWPASHRSGPQGSVSIPRGKPAENWFIRSKSILFRWNSMWQAPMQVRWHCTRKLSKMILFGSQLWYRYIL